QSGHDADVHLLDHVAETSKQTFEQRVEPNSKALSAPELLPALPDNNALASIIFTSGTTGTPKGVMLTHANFTSLLASMGGVFKITEQDRFLSVLPLHHTFEFTCGFLLPLSRGATITYL